MKNPWDTPQPLISDRVQLDRLTSADARALVQLLNEPGWLRFIGDRGVSTEQDAVAYLETARQNSDAGMGLFAVRRNDDRQLLGMCTLIQRAYLSQPDLGFALFAAQAGHGFAQEASARLMRYVFEGLALPELSAITLPENARSIALLERLGFLRAETLQVPAENGREESLLHYRISLQAWAAARTS